jgi:hypothetical protein
MVVAYITILSHSLTAEKLRKYSAGSRKTIETEITKPAITKIRYKNECVPKLILKSDL